MRRPDLRTALKGVASLAFGVLLVLLLITAAPQLVGADESYTVLSSSMNPTFQAGDVIIVRETPTDTIDTQDVIVFQTPSDSDHSRITHRVVEVVQRDGQTLFRTKGDANEEPDPELVPASNVVGEVVVAIPKIGYLTRMVNSTFGVVAFVVVPAGLLVVTELLSVARMLGESDESGTHDGGSER